MKKLIASFCLLVFVFPLRAQSFDDGVNLVSLGFGLPVSERIKKDFSEYKDYTDYKFKNYGTVVLKYEHGLQKYFGMGLNLEYSNSSVTYKYDDNNLFRYQVNIKSNVFGAFWRMNGHLPIGEIVDVYGGVGLGYLYTVNKYLDSTQADVMHVSKVFDFDYQLSAGVRCMVKENVGLFAEVGRATTLFQLGAVVKF
jgi:hypothetical protein